MEKTRVYLVNRIRRYVFEKYILPAIKEGRERITIRAGDIHKELGLKNRMPAVCNALRSRIEIFNQWLKEKRLNFTLKLESVKTPPSGYGANAFFTYKIIAYREGLRDQKLFIDQGYGGDESGEDKPIINEERARKIMSRYLGISLYKKKLNINGKYKEFDMVNLEHRVVGDFKRFTYRGQASAEMSNLVEYVWLMEKLEKYTGVKWRKIIVGAGNKETFKKFSRRYDPWLEDLEIYFITENGEVVKIRK